MTVFISRPTRVEAVQWLGDNEAEVTAAVNVEVRFTYSFAEPAVPLLRLLAGKDGAQELVPVPVGHWIVHLPGDDSDYWPVDPEFFAGKYQEDVDGPASTERVVETIAELQNVLSATDESEVVMSRHAALVSRQVLAWLVYELLQRLVPTVRIGETLLSARYVREDARTVP